MDNTKQTLEIPLFWVKDIWGNWVLDGTKTFAAAYRMPRSHERTPPGMARSRRRLTTGTLEATMLQSMDLGR